MTQRTESRTKVWIDRSAFVVLLVGATFFWSAMLEGACARASYVLGIPLQIVGALGLALFTLGLGALVVTGGRLAWRLKDEDASRLRALVVAHLLTAAQVLAGAAMTLLFFYLR